MKSLYSIVGMKHHQSTTLVAAMKDGTPLTLRRDPNNRHDYNAVEVVYEGNVIAFVKGTEVAGLARWMDDQGKGEVEGQYTVGADRWAQVEVDH